MAMNSRLRHLSLSLWRTNPRIGSRASTVPLLSQRQAVRDQHATPAEPPVAPALEHSPNRLSSNAEPNIRNIRSPYEKSRSFQTPQVVNWSPESLEVGINFTRLGPVKYAAKLDRFPNLWLRDNCQCQQCTHPQTKQRLIDTFEIDPDIKIASLEPSHAGLAIKWANPKHESYFPWSWLMTHVPSPATKSSRWSRRWDHVPPASDISAYPAVTYDSIMSPDNHGLLAYLTAIEKYGFCLAPNTPVTTEATEALLNRIAFIRPTHYGAFWDFTSIANPTDTAYTTLPLPAHTDNTYFTDPCGLQLFHILSHTNGSGGESILVDGFAAAKHLHKISPKHYDILSEIPIISHASGDVKAGLIDNTARQRGYPVFIHDHLVASVSPSAAPGRRSRSAYYPLQETQPGPKHLTQIRWNNDDRSPLTRFESPKAMKAWYEAARVWSGILKMPEFEIVMQLEPGNPVIFDNWRVLHGRRAFTGERRVCGGYIGMDDYRAKLKGLKRDLLVERDEIGAEE
jgi:trimethyllysine dioxygenase